MRTTHVPIRTCLGCGRKRPKKELARIVLKDGALIMDEKGGFPGRGAYLCPQGECVSRLLKKRGRLSHALRGSLPDHVEEGFLRGIAQAWGGEGKG
jgi:predicted RNA-binding protein YlxR (DUF448 family)